MNRTMRAVLHYTAEDLKWVLVVSLILGLLGEGLGLAATLLGEPEDAGKMVVGTMLAISFLVSMILSIVYLANQFTMFLSFSATRRGAHRRNSAARAANQRVADSHCLGVGDGGCPGAPYPDRKLSPALGMDSLGDLAAGIAAPGMDRAASGRSAPALWCKRILVRLRCIYDRHHQHQPVGGCRGGFLPPCPLADPGRHRCCGHCRAGRAEPALDAAGHRQITLCAPYYAHEKTPVRKVLRAGVLCCSCI